MRLARPVYECMPLVYAALGALGLVVAYLDPEGPRTLIALGIAIAMEIAALTVSLRRQDYRARGREYSSQLLELVTRDLPPAPRSGALHDG